MPRLGPRLEEAQYDHGHMDGHRYRDRRRHEDGHINLTMRRRAPLRGSSTSVAGSEARRSSLTLHAPSRSIERETVHCEGDETPGTVAKHLRGDAGVECQQRVGWVRPWTRAPQLKSLFVGELADSVLELLERHVPPLPFFGSLELLARRG